MGFKYVRQFFSLWRSSVVCFLVWEEFFTFLALRLYIINNAMTGANYARESQTLIFSKSVLKLQEAFKVWNYHIAQVYRSSA